MPLLPERPHLDHLKKQAKALLRDYVAGNPDALARLRASLPVAKDADEATLRARDLRLHDAQSCVAREHGFLSWSDLKRYVDWRASCSHDRARLIGRWLTFVYGHKGEQARPALAARMLDDTPDLVQGDALLSCAVGDEAGVRAAIAADRDWVRETRALWRCPGCGAALGRPPLIAVAHSSLSRLDRFRDPLERCARLLLDAGADPNQSWSENGGHAVSALYGAAGRNHHPAMTRRLLTAGADPNDGEALYHAIESDDLTCARLLLAHGAKIEGSNALFRNLDNDHIDGLRLLLAHGADPNEPSGGLDCPLHHAIRRGRSPVHVELLLRSGADARVRTHDGMSAYTLALRYGLTDVAGILAQAGAAAQLPEDEQYIAACARADRGEALRWCAARPDLPAGLTTAQRGQLPRLAEQGGHYDAIRLMLELGWPIGIADGVGWRASALNHAVARGDAATARLLLEHGASWTEPNGFDDNVHGSLAFASRNNYGDGERDWLGCAAALVAHGMPLQITAGSDYSDEVAEFFAEERAKRGDTQIG